MLFRSEAIQSVEDVAPHRVMSLPKNVTHTTSGAKINYPGGSAPVTREALRDPLMHDWMKDYAKNLKETIGENGVLPRGTQELLDAPTFAEGNAALEKYLEGKYPGRFKNVKLQTIMPDSEGFLKFTHGEKNVRAQVSRSSIDENLVKEIKSPITSKAGQGLSIGSPIEMKTVAGAPRRIPIQKATAATQAKIASSVAMETIEENVGKVVQRSGATSRLLGAATEASAHVAGGAAKSGLLREVAAAATILKTIT